jgi:molecular chaperone HscA
MLRDSYEHAKDDMHSRALHEARVEAQRLLEAVRAALAVDGALLSAAEREAIDRQVAALAAVATASEHRAIRQASDALNRATEEFAGRRMDAGVKRALAGRNIASLDL